MLNRWDEKGDIVVLWQMWQICGGRWQLYRHGGLLLQGGSWRGLLLLTTIMLTNNFAKEVQIFKSHHHIIFKTTETLNKIRFWLLLKENRSTWHFGLDWLLPFVNIWLTTSIYQLVGCWLKKRERSNIVLATKLGIYNRPGDLNSPGLSRWRRRSKTLLLTP